MTPLRSNWAWFAGVCLFAILLRMPIAGIPLDRNEGECAYTAQRWMQGDIPYRDVFNQTLPASFVTYAIIERTVGTTALAIHWGAQLYTLGTLAILFLLARRLSSPAGGLAAAAFAAFMTTDPSVLGNAANAEVFMLLPLSAAMLALSYAIETGAVWWAFATGALAAAAALFTPAAVPNLIFCGLAVAALSPRRFGGVAALLLGVACTTLPAVAYFISHGAGSALYNAVIHNSDSLQRLPVASSPQAFWKQSPALVWSFWPILLLAATQIVAGFVVRPAPVGGEVQPAPHRHTLLALAWLVASFVGTASSGAFRPQDHVQLIPPFALLAGMAVSLLARGSRREWVALGLVVVPLAIGILSNSWYYAPGDANAKSLRLYANPVFVAAAAVGGFVADHAQPEDSVFVLGSDAEILHHAARRSATRSVIVDPRISSSADSRQWQRETLKAVQHENPRFIVTVFLPSSFPARPDTLEEIFDGTRDMINRSYRLAAVVEMAPRDSAHPLVSGEPAEAAWLVAPVWYGGPSWWCALAVWERVAHADAANRSAAEAESRAGGDLAAKGDTEGAITHYREAIRLDPNFSAAHNNLAAVLAKAGRVDEAIAEYVEAVRLAPLRAEPHWNLAGVLLDAGRLPEAIPQLRAAVFFNPLAEMRYRLATAYVQAGQIREAQDELEQVLREHPESNGAEAKMAWLLATANDDRLRNGPRAVQLAEDAARRTEHRDANVLNSLAAAYAEVGRYADAADVAEKAIAVAPSSGQAGLRDALAQRLDRYHAGQPVREGPGAQAP